MSLFNIKRARFASALRSILRVATGRNIPRAEIDNRVAAYLSAGKNRGLGPDDKSPQAPPLFVADDYKPTSGDDALGGPDGRDLSRSWAAVREDLDCSEEGLSESERRLETVTQVFRHKSSSILRELNSSTLAIKALEQQVQSSFFGGPGGSSSAGRGHLVWNIACGDNLLYPQTTGILLGGLGSLPTLGNSTGNTNGGTVVGLTLIGTSDSTLLSSRVQRQWIENPFSIAPSAWNFTGPSWVDVSLDTGDISVLELHVSEGTSVSKLENATTGQPINFDVLKNPGGLWLNLSSAYPQGSEMRVYFTGQENPKHMSAGAVYGLKGHSLSLNPTCAFVWGPFATLSGNDITNDSLFTVTLDSAEFSTPAGGGIEWQISSVSPDGPWATVSELGTPLVFGANGRAETNLFNSLPDPLTLGYYYFPISNAGSMQGGVFSAGINQAKVDSYFYNWTQERDAQHVPTQTDWVNPRGIVRTVALSVGPTYFGDQGVSQASTSAQYLSAGTCLANYTDISGQSLSAIVLTTKDPTQKYLLQQGYNYRFSWGLWSSGYSTLSNMPIGLLNPNGSAAGSQGTGYLVSLNGNPIYKSSSYFTNYAELSGPPANYGTLSSHYTPLGTNSTSQGNTNLSAPPGAAWPPFCGRMNLNLRPGWNVFEIDVYMSLQETGHPETLGPCAAIVFGPNIFSDPALIYRKTGIQNIRGWKSEWTQESEFDLRSNTPLGMQECWSWKTDPDKGGISGILLNHNPTASETGFLTLDNVLTGNARNHHLSYIQDYTNQISDTLVPGQEPLSSKIWVRAHLTTSQTESGPLISSYQLSIN